jgi:hypothetical protein
MSFGCGCSREQVTDYDYECECVLGGIDDVGDVGDATVTVEKFGFAQ